MQGMTAAPSCPERMHKRDSPLMDNVVKLLGIELNRQECGRLRMYGRVRGQTRPGTLGSHTPYIWPRPPSQRGCAYRQDDAHCVYGSSCRICVVRARTLELSQRRSVYYARQYASRGLEMNTDSSTNNPPFVMFSFCRGTIRRVSVDVEVSKGPDIVW